MRVTFEMFSGMLIRWEDLFQQACDFATKIGKDRLINISHSENHKKGIVTVWYWTE
ncbi:MAG: hypothetical protein JW828_14375 [Sedimentisphaerales bacterium]|nr:hypothetical protein [Sedimentisphaerales bacterium]